MAFAALSIFIAIGIAHLSVIGTKVDRPWIKFVVTAADLAAASSLFAIIPVSRADDIPQIVAFRAYGIYYLFPLIALTCLTLSWRLVIWSGIIAAIGWWAAFFWSIMDIERPLSWDDIPVDATRSDYQNFFFSFDFVGYGNRLEETGFLLAAAIVLAAAVYRARKVFFAQVAAEMDREAERQARSAVTETLGRFVPEQIVQQLIDNKGALDPQTQHGSVLALDIAGFTAYAAKRTPRQVIEELNAFLAACADLIGSSQGLVASYTGDGLIAAFNIPLRVAQPEEAASAAALQILALSANRNIPIRIGIASGDIAAGRVGSERSRAFTIYGDAVNRAARLESLNKTLGTTLLIDEHTHRKLGDAPAWIAMGQHELRGISLPQTVWAHQI